MMLAKHAGKLTKKAKGKGERMKEGKGRGKDGKRDRRKEGTKEEKKEKGKERRKAGRKQGRKEGRKDGRKDGDRNAGRNVRTNCTSELLRTCPTRSVVNPPHPACETGLIPTELLLDSLLALPNASCHSTELCVFCVLWLILVDFFAFQTTLEKWHRKNIQKMRKPEILAFQNTPKTLPNPLKIDVPKNIRFFIDFYLIFVICCKRQHQKFVGRASVLLAFHTT